MNNNTNVYSLLLLMVAIATLSVIGGGSGGGLVATLPGFDNAYGLAAAGSRQQLLIRPKQLKEKNIKEKKTCLSHKIYL